MTQHLLLTVVLLLCTLHLSTCNETTMCMSQGGYVYLRMGCDNGEMIHVYQAFYAKVNPDRSPNCGNPEFQDGDCIALAADTTEFFRSECNGFSNCNKHRNYPSGVVCPSEYDSSRLILRVQYECLQRQDPHGRDMNPMFPLMRSVSSHTAAQVHLRTTDYPSTLQTGNRHSCRIDLAPSIQLRMDVLDLFAEGTRSSMDSGYCLYLGNLEPICASPGSHFPLVYFNPGPSTTVWLWFWSMAAEDLPVRFWVIISAINSQRHYGGADSMTVTCGYVHGTLQTEYVTLPTPGIGGAPINSGGSFPTWRPSTRPTTTSQGTSAVGEGTSTPGDVGVKEPLKDSDMMTYVIIGGAAAGSLLVIVIILIIAFACTRRKARRRDTNYDYITSANVAKATKLGATLGNDPENVVYSYSENIKGQDEKPGIYAADIPQDDGVYSELPSLPASPVTPVTPYAIFGNHVPAGWQYPEPAPAPEYTHEAFPGSYDIMPGEETPDEMYVNHGYYGNEQADQMVYSEVPEAPQSNVPPPVDTATLNAQKKSKLMADLEKLYAKPTKKVRSDEAFIVENDIYRG